MTNKEAINILSEMPISTMSGRTFNEIADALKLAIEALKNERPRFRHVTLNHPRFGKCDACYDEKRMLFYTEAAS